MKKLLALSLLALALPMVSGAQTFRLEFGANGIDLSAAFKFNQTDDGFVEFEDGDLYYPVARTCGLRKVYIVISGGVVNVERVKVLFANGETQRLRGARGWFGNGDGSNPIDLEGNRRCIVGFSVEATTHQGWGDNGAFLTLYGIGRNNGRHSQLGSVFLRQFFERRDHHRQHGWQHRGGWRNGGWHDGHHGGRGRPDRPDRPRGPRGDGGIDIQILNQGPQDGMTLEIE